MSVKVLLVFTGVIGILVPSLELGSIRAYLKSKPLGMQTTFDRLSSDLSILVQVHSVVLGVILIIPSTLGPFHYIIAHIVVVGLYWIILVLACTIFMTTMVRYGLIYYGTLVESVEEDKIVRWFRMTTMSWAAVATLMDGYRGLGGPSTVIFRYMVGLINAEGADTSLEDYQPFVGINPGPSFGMTALILTTLTSLAHSRILFDSKKKRQDNDNSNTGTKMRSL